MRANRTNTDRVFFVVGLVFCVLLLSAGCGKKPQAGQPPKPETVGQVYPSVSEKTTAATELAAQIEQTTCPVSGDPIDKTVFVEYKGKKVYFCCSACVASFKADPEKYLAKLPQFKK